MDSSNLTASKRWKNRFIKLPSIGSAKSNDISTYSEDDENLEEIAHLAAAEPVNEFDITQRNVAQLTNRNSHGNIEPRITEELWKDLESKLSENDLPSFRKQSLSPGANRVSRTMTPELETEAQLQIIYQAKQYQMMLFAVLVIFANSMSFLTFSEMNSKCAEAFYEVDGKQMVDYLAVVFLLMYPFGSFFTNSVVFTKGIKFSLSTGTTITLSGYTLRIISLYLPPHSYHRYNCVLIGQFLLGFSQPMLLNPIIKIANNWFAPLERDWMASLMFLGHPFGIVAGIVLSNNVMTEGGCRMGYDFKVMFWIQITVTIVGWCCICFFEDTPPSPPSVSNRVMLQSAKSRRDEVEVQNLNVLICTEFKWLVTNPDFRLLSLAFVCFYLLMYNTLIETTKTEMATEYGYSVAKMASCANSFVFGTLFGTFLYGMAMTFNGYHSTRKIGSFALVFALLFYECWIAFHGTSAYPQVGYFIFASIGMPLVPVSLITAAEITYDVPEEFFVGMLFSLGNIGIILKYALCGQDIQDSSIQNRTIQVIIAIIGCFISCQSRGLYKRAKAEKMTDFKLGEHQSFEDSLKQRS